MSHLTEKTYDEKWNELSAGIIDRVGETVSRCFFRGVIEQIDDDEFTSIPFKNSIKVRIPRIHGNAETGLPTERLPNTILSMILRSWCMAWDEPLLYKNKASIKSSGKIEVEGTLDIKNMGGQASSPFSAYVMLEGVPLTGQAGFGQAPAVTSNGKVKLTAEKNGIDNASIEFETDEYDKMDLTPQKNSLWPFNKIREGEHLLRKGDIVLVSPIEGYAGTWFIHDVLSFKGSQEVVASQKMSIASLSEEGSSDMEEKEYKEGEELFIDTSRTSPNKSSRGGSKIDMIIIHHTETTGLERTLRWFENPQSSVSAHYVIGKKGGVYRMVDESMKAWHAGKSWRPNSDINSIDWNHQDDINQNSIGIELVNKGDGSDPFTEQQMRALVKLISMIKANNPGITTENIWGHRDISPVRKMDPADNFDWGRLGLSNRPFYTKNQLDAISKKMS